MSIFDDIPLPIGTTWSTYKIIGWNAREQKYQIQETRFKGELITYWRSRANIEARHAESLLTGVEVREAKPGNSYNTRYFRSKE
jgi:hypothetical protein